MRAVVLRGPNQFAPEDIPVPEIGNDEILLEMKAAAICGTDMRILTGKKTKGVRYPSVIGHEFCGIIAKVGADVKGYEVGEKVAVVNRKAIGYEFDGGFEEYIRIPGICIENGNVVKLPDSVSFAAGALIEPLSCCIRGLRNAGTGFNDDVLIVGAGPIGLFHLQLAKIAGARKVIVSEPNEQRRKVAAELGADLVVDPMNENLEEIVKRETNGLGMDVIVMAIGVPPLVNPTLKLCKKGGTVNLFAGFAGTGECKIEVNTIHYNEINVNGSTAYKLEDYLAAAEMIKSGKIDADKIVTHKFKIEDFQKAYDVCVAGTGLKVIIEP